MYQRTRSLGIKKSLSEIPLVDTFLFQEYQQANKKHKMNEIVNKLSLAGDKFIPKMHLRQPGLKETGDL